MSIIFNGISDSWTDRCYYVDSTFIDAVASAFNHLFRYDCFFFIEFLTLIIFPIFFKIYGSGLQQRLRLFYDHSRLIFINLAILCCLTLSISTIMHLLVHQSPPCAIWDGKNIIPFRSSSKTPHESLILIFLIFEFSLTIDIELKLFFIISSSLFTFLYILILLLSGNTSFSQILISIFVATWIFALHKFNPPIVKVFLSFTMAIITLIFFAITYSKLNWLNVFNHEAFHNSFRASFGLIASNLLFIHFSKQRKHFNWLKTNWVLNKHLWVNGESNDAIIPSTSSESQKDDFGNLLTYDLIGGIFGFILYLTGDLILYYLDRHFFIYV